MTISADVLLPRPGCKWDGADLGVKFEWTLELIDSKREASRIPSVYVLQLVLDRSPVE